MNRRIWVTLVSLAVAQFSWGQTNAVSTPVIAENAALDPGTLALIGATAEQETAYGLRFSSCTRTFSPASSFRGALEVPGSRQGISASCAQGFRQVDVYPPGQPDRVH